MPRSASLSREAIARAALDLTDREGVEALSMRTLADRLEVGTMTLYGYFASKDELLEAMVATATEDAPAIAVGAGTWKEQLAGLMRGVRATLAEHPTGVALRLQRPLLTPAALRVTEAAMRIMDEAGFTPAQAARAYRTMFVYTFGFASFNPAGADGEAKRRARTALAALPEAEYPSLAAASDELVDAMGGDEQFEFGLALLLDGLEAELRSKVSSES